MVSVPDDAAVYCCTVVTLSDDDSAVSCGISVAAEVEASVAAGAVPEEPLFEVPTTPQPDVMMTSAAAADNKINSFILSLQ